MCVCSACKLACQTSQWCTLVDLHCHLAVSGTARVKFQDMLQGWHRTCECASQIVASKLDPISFFYYYYCSEVVT